MLQKDFSAEAIEAMPLLLVVEFEICTASM